MTQPVRLQLSRRKGFDLQALSRRTNDLTAVKASRPGRWGNPRRIGTFKGYTAANAARLWMHRDLTARSLLADRVGSLLAEPVGRVLGLALGLVHFSRALRLDGARRLAGGISRAALSLQCKRGDPVPVHRSLRHRLLVGKTQRAPEIRSSGAGGTRNREVGRVADRTAEAFL